MKLILMLIFLTSLFTACAQSENDDKQQQDLTAAKSKDTLGRRPFWLENEVQSYDVIVSGDQVGFDNKSFSLHDFRIALKRLLKANYLKDKPSQTLSFKLSYVQANTTYDDFKKLKQLMLEEYKVIWNEKSQQMYDKGFEALPRSEQRTLKKEIPFWIVEGNPH